jgi:uncharacterized protein YjiS (DUF1127 family)
MLMQNPYRITQTDGWRPIMLTKAHSRRPSWAETPRRLFAWLGRRAMLSRSRKAMARLDDHLLRDIGLTRAEAEAQARRPPWDPPLHWKG